jgi:CPA2 family monovalent cation:H+ antiporter-2
MADPAGLLRDILVILAAAVVVVSIAERVRLGPILGYLIAGVAIGPAALGLISDLDAPRALSELGVVFLLFTVGLELPLERLRLMPRAIYVLGCVQVLATALVVAGIAYLLGQSAPSSIAIGCVLSLSSTAIVLRLLSDRAELRTRIGRVALGILIMQDLAVAPLLVLLPAIKGTWSEIGVSLGLSLVRGALATGLILGFGRLALRPLMNAVAASKSPEIFAALTLLIVLAASALTHAFGLSMAFGALLAGMVLADTAYRHQVAAEISPFRGLLLGLFFMTVGMLLDADQLRAQWPMVLGVVTGLLGLKAAIIFALARGRLLPPSAALRLGLMLAQGGEFAFVLLLLARKEALLDENLAQLISVSVILSMMATPLLAAAGRKLAPKIARQGEIDQDALPRLTGEIAGHVVIAGYGRIGAGVARRLDERAIRWVAIDTDPNLVVGGRKAGKPVYYGDADRIEILEALGLADAIGVVVAISDQERAIQMVALVHYILPQLPILARAYDEDHAEALMKAGAHEAVPEPSPLTEMITERLMARLEGALAQPINRG